MRPFRLAAVALAALLATSCGLFGGHADQVDGQALDRLAAAYLEFSDPTLDEAEREDVLLRAVPDLLGFTGVDPDEAALTWAHQIVEQWPALAPYEIAVASAWRAARDRGGDAVGVPDATLVLAVQYLGEWNAAETHHDRMAVLTAFLADMSGVDVSGVVPSASASLAVALLSRRHPELAAHADLLARLLTAVRLSGRDVSLGPGS